MLFRFLKYIQPTHYFQLYRNDGTSIFPDIRVMPENIRQMLPPDPNFNSERAAEYDQSWRAVRGGYTYSSATYNSFEKTSLEDEYYFLSKYFHPVWGFYVLLLRFLSFNNIIQEVRAWKKSRQKKKPEKIIHPIDSKEWESFESTLISSHPFITIIIPTLNRYEYLKDILNDLEKQDYKNFEVIIVDQSEPFQKEFYDQFTLDINLIEQKEKALWLARNTAIKSARGNIIALSEDDVRIPEDWLSKHLACLDFFDADISAGVFFPEGSKIPEERSFFSIASQFATGNAAIYKEVFEKTGLFDRQFEKQRMGDGEFGLRAYLLGFKSISNPYAYCLDLKAEEGGLREMGSWDSFRPKKFFSPRPIPSVLYFYRKYFGKKRAILALIKTVPPSIIPYKYRKNRLSMILGSFISLILFPVIIFQILISWNKSGKKLAQGPIISELS